MALVVIGIAAAAPEPKVQVCHLDHERDTVKLLNISASALLAHLAHGDGLPGETVAGRTFTQECEIVPIGVTVLATDSTGRALPDVHVRFGSSNGGFQTFGVTGPDGTVTRTDLPVGSTYDFYASFVDDNNHTSPTQTVTISDGTTIYFHTVNALVQVQSCSGPLPLEGARVLFGSSNGGFKEFGYTGPDGLVSGELFDGRPVEFYAEYNFTRSAKQQVAIVNGIVATFETATVELASSQPILYGITPNSGWHSFQSPEQMFPGTYAFKFGDVLVEDFVVSGCQMKQMVNVLKVKDHLGNPIAGATARGGAGTNYTSYFVAGASDANGTLFDIRSYTTPPTTWSYEMKVNNTTAVLTQDVTVNSVFAFQTSLLTVRLETCSGTPLDGGVPAYGKDGVAGTWFFPGGSTGSAAVPGESAAELFPGVYSFRMAYKATTDYRYNINLPAGGAQVTFQTTAVTLNYPGDISYGGTTGDSTWFTKPTMELLPGTTMFHYRPYNGYAGYTAAHTLSGCTFNRALITAVMDDCSGGYMPAVDFSWYKWGAAATTFPAGTTDGSGPLTFFVDAVANPSIVVIANLYGASHQVGPQIVLSNPAFTFTGQWAEVDLQDHTGTDIPITAANELKFYPWGQASNKQDMALAGGNGQQCFLPGSYVFTIAHNLTATGSGQHNIATPYLFQTGAVINGIDPDVFDAETYYQYANAANPGTFFDYIELLPVTTRFVGSSLKTLDVQAGQVLNLFDGTYNAPTLSSTAAPPREGDK